MSQNVSSVGLLEVIEVRPGRLRLNAATLFRDWDHDRSPPRHQRVARDVLEYMKVRGRLVRTRTHCFDIA